MAQEKERILGVDITITPMSKLLDVVPVNIKERRQKGSKKPPLFITTPNPEQLLVAQKDIGFLRILNSSDLAIPDGIGLVMAERFSHSFEAKNMLLRASLGFLKAGETLTRFFFDKKWFYQKMHTLKGREFFLDLIKIADEKRWRVFLLGAGPAVAKNTAAKLSQKYKNVEFSWDSGPELEAEGLPVGEKEKKKEQDVLKKIDKFRPHILFVAFGAPKQEKWVQRHLRRLDAGAVMVVGGTFNYVSGKSSVPPSFVSNTGLEWLWRLVHEPNRIIRILRAVVVFPWFVYRDKIKNS